MTFLNDKFQGVVVGGRASPLFAGKPLAPRFYAALIQSIGGWSYLNKYGVELIFFKTVDDCNEFMLLLL
jgi:hypothetical protein